MNNTIFYFLYSFAHKSVLLDNLIIFCAVYLPFMAIILALVFLLFHHEVFYAENKFKAILKKWKEIIFVFFVSGFAWVVAKIFKTLIHTDRPFISLGDVHSLFSETGFAFPSGHATFFMALATSIFLIHKKVGYAFIAIAIVIGITRVAGGVHFPIDILGGFVLGALVAYLVKNI